MFYISSCLAELLLCIYEACGCKYKVIFNRWRHNFGPSLIYVVGVKNVGHLCFPAPLGGTNIHFFAPEASYMLTFFWKSALKKTLHMFQPKSKKKYNSKDAVTTTAKPFSKVAIWSGLYSGFCYMQTLLVVLLDVYSSLEKNDCYVFVRPWDINGSFGVRWSHIAIMERWMIYPSSRSYAPPMWAKHSRLKHVYKMFTSSLQDQKVFADAIINIFLIPM